MDDAQTEIALEAWQAEKRIAVNPYQDQVGQRILADLREASAYLMALESRTIQQHVLIRRIHAILHPPSDPTRHF